MDFHPCGSRPSIRTSAEYFTGTVWQDPINQTAGLRGAYVRFEPGARTNWHTHPLGQTLCVVSGSGRAQAWGGDVREIRAGDVVWFPAGEKHWHGAGPNTTMVHIAMTEVRDNKYVEWLEKVTDAQYNGA
jgi:quercetin dioxygenase-like cupin family protein